MSEIAGHPTVSEDAHTIMVKKVSWGAIFAGTAVALIVQVLLTMLGLGIGVATLDPGTGDSPAASTFSIVAGIWYIVSGIVAAFAGGYVAARMSGRPDPTTGAFHGLTTWAFTMLVVLYLLTTTVGSIIGGAFAGLSNAIGGLGETVAQAAGPVLERTNPLEAIERQVSATGTDPEALNSAAVNAIRALVTGDDANAEAARQEAAQALASARNIPIDEAEARVVQIVERYEQGVEQARQQATEAADAAASAVSTGALVAFVAMILGAVAAWLGGRSGVVHPIFADRVVPVRRTSL
ncbi:hypothetical protein [Arenibaculum sp.]|uniref:hypothetical protein n=1 Tax=Arenibaculum sp. TaxID=2865862 RepID=UPI002E118E36|nr:hypothetical protein [Arenibaculum sp.]